MEQRIQYATTSDGVNIAYATIGSGHPLVQCAGLLGHTQKEWEFSERRAWIERLARTYTFVRFDHRGSGLSDRQVSDVSVDAWVRDLEAVIERERFERLALFAPSAGAGCAISYAAKHPERVSHIVLWHPRSITIAEADPVGKVLAQLRDVDWELYTDAVVLWVQGWSGGEASAKIGELFRAASTPEMARAVTEAQGDYDLTTAMASLQAKTLLLYRPGARWFNEDAVRATAAAIPHSRSAFLQGDTFSWYMPDPEPIVQAIEEFIAGDRPPSPSETSTGVFRTILFTDIESSTPLTQRLGDAGAQEVLRKHNSIVRDAVNQSSGSEIKHTGDGIMASFPSASGAVKAAVAIQRAFARHNEEDPDTAISVRIGLNAGEPVTEAHPDGQSDLFGTSVILAARIAAKAEGGEILCSDVVRQLVAGKRFLFNDRGDTELRGFEDPVRVYEVRWSEDE